MARAQIHYNLDNIDKENANFNLIYGEKSNGKSYQVKHKKAIEKYLKTGRRFILMRRWDSDLTSSWIESYFSDVDIQKLTNNKYNCVTKFRNELYLTTITEEFKKKRGEKIGYVIPISLEQRYSSASFLDVDDIIVEEFMSRGMYIVNEPSKLMTFYSTVDRKRGTTKLWLVGNTVSRICPYLAEWGLVDIMKNQKQGEIKTKIIHNEANDVKIAIEYCRSSGGKTMTIGQASSMIDKGNWQTDIQPKLPKSRKNYKCLFRFGFQYQGFKFICEFLQEKENKKYPCWFIYPFYKEFDENFIVFSDMIKISPYWQRDIYNITIKNDKLRNLFRTFREDIIFYSSDLCGTDFKQVIDFSIKK